MPNHITNEIIFRNVDAAKRAELLASLCGADGRVDFNVLVPAPLNMWWGSTGKKHEDAFRQTHLDWARHNWGTKWNAYDHMPIEQTEDTLTLRFDTAWRPPYGWLAAIFNKFVISFEHNWLDEGADRGVSGIFNADFHRDDMRGDPWNETPATDDMQRHLHKLKWGVEEFKDDDETEAVGDQTHASTSTA